MFVYRKLLPILVSFLVSIFVGQLSSEEEKKGIKIESLKAEKAENDEKGNLLLEGKVFIKTDLLNFKTDKAIFNESEGLLELLGNVEVESRVFNLRSTELKANLNQQSFSIKQANFNRGNSFFGETDEFLIETTGDIKLVNSSVTSCSEDDPTWKVSTKSITYLNEKKNTVVRGIKLKVKNVPVFYFPYLRTALGKERMSGFLTPGLNQTNNGLDISLPYYFNLAPNYDLVLTPRYITNRGSGVASSFRYLNRKIKGEINFSGLSNDKRYEEDTGRNNSRWNISLNNNMTFTENFFSSINFHSVSDEYFFRDLGNNQFGETRTSYLPRKFGLTWNSPYIKVNLDAHRYQILNPFSAQEYRVMPSLTFQSYLSKNDMFFSLLVNKTRFELEQTNTFINSFRRIDRSYLAPEFSVKKHFPSSQLSLSMGSQYISHKTDSFDSSKSSPWGELQYKIFLVKAEKGTYSKLIPTVKYIFVEEQDTQLDYFLDSRLMSNDYRTLFERSRYAGFDMITTNNKVILGLQRLSWSKSKGHYHSFSIGQAFYFDKKPDYLNSIKNTSRSPVVSEFKFELNTNLWSKGLVEWDKYSKKLLLASLGFAYETEDQKRIEFKSIYRRKNQNKVYIPWADRETPTNQTEILVQWPLSKSFSIFGRWKKDQELNTSNDILFGFEYSSCCLKWGLMHRKWVDEEYFLTDNKILTFNDLSRGLNPSRERDRTYIFFELKNIGRFGKEISKALSSTKLE